MNSNKVIGIDLGTTFSCAAVMEGNSPVIIENAEGTRTTPSVVAFTRTGERVVGQLAKRQAITNPLRTVQSIKREMGSNYRVKINEVEYTPEQISAMILQKLKTDAEAYLGQVVTKAVITVPAYFNDAQRQATRDAGSIAGLEVLRIINEPTASALAYGLNRLTGNSKVLVFDLGGGTFDVSILEVTDGVFEVKSTAGNNRLGGDDFDQCIIDWLKAQFLETQGIDLSSDLMAIQRLKEAAEKAKIELSSTMVSEINLPFLTADASGPRHLETTLTRTQFNELTANLIDATMVPLQQALEDSQLNLDQIEHILLVGGSTRIPAVQESIKRYFGRDPIKSINPDEAVALGAAIQASILSGEVSDVLLLDITSLSLGIETAGELFTRIIERNTTIPTSRTMIFTTAADGQSSVEIHVLQGERELACYNQSLARFQLSDIPPAPRGVPKIEVTFDIDADGITHVSARDAGSGIKSSVIIQRTAGLEPEEVERMQKEAAQNARQDKELKEKITTRVRAESLVAESERTINKYGEKADRAYVEKVKQTIQTVKDVLNTDDTEVLAAAIVGLDASLLDLGRDVHQKGKARGARVDHEKSDQQSLKQSEPIELGGDERVSQQTRRSD